MCAAVCPAFAAVCGLGALLIQLCVCRSRVAFVCCAVIVLNYDPCVCCCVRCCVSVAMN